MKPVRIAFDLDGVLVDFESGIAALGFQYPKERIPDEEFFAWRESLYREIDKQGAIFWESLPALRGYLQMYNLARMITSNIRIITAYPAIWTDFKRKDACYIGKKAWVLRHLGFDASMHFIMSYAHEKCLYCDSEKYLDIIIDDRESTIHEWESKGGMAIHHKSLSETIERLEDIKYMVYKETRVDCN